MLGLQAQKVTFQTTLFRSIRLNIEYFLLRVQTPSTKHGHYTRVESER